MRPWRSAIERHECTRALGLGLEVPVGSEISHELSSYCQETLGTHDLSTPNPLVDSTTSPC
jgi:hypothetical protein